MSEIVSQDSVRLNPSDETIDLGTTRIRFLVAGSDSQGSVAMFEMWVAGKGRLTPPAHSHDAYEETIYGLEGELVWTVNGVPIGVGPGHSLCIPRGAVHRFDNERREPATALAAITPAVIGPPFFREMAEVIMNAAGGPPDRARMIETMLRHGLTPVGSESR